MLITMDMVKEAQAFLKDKTEHTQLRKSRCLPDTVHIKCENLQKTGSFKIRGALNRMRFLSEAEKKKGVIAASAGNHAQGVAFGAKLYGIKATIVMPETAPMIKVLATQKYGAEVVLHGDYYDHAYEKACEIAKKEGLVFVHPYQDPYVIAGQGTIGLEILEDFAQVDQVVVPIGGGGLIGGISFVLKTINPKIEVIGVVSEQTQGMRQLKEGDIVSAPTYVNTIADGIAVKKPSPEMFKNYIHPYVDQIVSVSDNEIAEAIVNLMEKDKMIAEGSGAAGVAAVIANKFKLKPNAVVLVCGGNIDLNTMFSVIETGLRRKGRHTRISIIVSDLPGQLARITQMMAKARANILDVMHDRVSSELSVRETRIDFLLETSGIEHAKQIEDMLKDAGVHLLKGEHS
ncbi:MAG: threonine ammonia-lyase [Bdellovibrionales bacterium]|nr:threonine ammonia-lyase [Bdellovibrionales bacterium]